MFIPFSIVSQVDGLMASLLRLRIERDVFAVNAEQSACKFYGCERWRSWSTFTGWFFTGLEVPAIVKSLATAQVHHALGIGVFVVPRCTGAEWFESLYAKALLRVTASTSI